MKTSICLPTPTIRGAGKHPELKECAAEFVIMRHCSNRDDEPEIVPGRQFGDEEMANFSITRTCISESPPRGLKNRNGGFDQRFLTESPMNFLHIFADNRFAGSFTASILAALAVGCASIPDVTVSYRPVKWSINVAVAHTITCNRESNFAIIEQGVVFLPVYSAGPRDPRLQIRLKELNRFASDADISIALTEDGRLRSINQTTVGQGETVVKSTIGLAAATSARTAISPLEAKRQPSLSLFRNNQFISKVERIKPANLCEAIKAFSISTSDHVAQVSLVQTALIKPELIGNEVNADPSKDQKELFDELEKIGLNLSVKVKTRLDMEELQPIIQPEDTVYADAVPVTIQRIASLMVEAIDTLDPKSIIGTKSIPVPRRDVFVLPVPKAALFGKQSFSVTLGDSGRITSIGYGRTTGAPAAIGVGTSLVGAEVTEDTAKAATLKAASDLIAQQQRYSNCTLRPAECK